MISYDYFAMLGEIKKVQEEIIALFKDHLEKDSQPRVYTLNQVQEILQISKRLAATWISQRILPHTRVGAKIWVTEAQLKEFLEKNATDTSDSDVKVMKGRRK
jgi:hypothetical protein